MGRNSMAEPERRGAPSALAVSAVVVISVLLAIIVTEYRARLLQDTAEDQVYAWCGKLATEREEDGKWKRRSEEAVPEQDPWGNPLRLRYETTKYSEKLTVSSDGPDRKQWTRDDISWSVNNIEWIALAREGAGAVEEVAGAASRGVVGGAIEGVTDHIPKQLRDKMGIPSERDKPAEPSKQK